MNSPISKVRDFIAEKAGKAEAISFDCNIIESRLLDSLQLLELIYLIQEFTDVVIDFEALKIEDFASLAAIQENFFSTHRETSGEEPVGLNG